MGSKVILDYDEDGNPVLDTEQLAELDAERAALEARIDQLTQALLVVSQQQQDAASQTSIVDNLIAGDANKQAAYTKIQSAYDFLNRATIQWQEENDFEGQMMNPYEMLDEFSGTSVEKEFNEKFPELSMEDVIAADNSATQLKNVLDQVAIEVSKPKPTKLEEFGQKAKDAGVLTRFDSKADKAAKRLEDMLAEAEGIDPKADGHPDLNAFIR